MIRSAKIRATSQSRAHSKGSTRSLAEKSTGSKLLWPCSQHAQSIRLHATCAQTVKTRAKTLPKTPGIVRAVRCAFYATAATTRPWQRCRGGGAARTCCADSLLYSISSRFFPLSPVPVPAFDCTSVEVLGLCFAAARTAFAISRIHNCRMRPAAKDDGAPCKATV